MLPILCAHYLGSDSFWRNILVSKNAYDDALSIIALINYNTNLPNKFDQGHFKIFCLFKHINPLCKTEGDALCCLLLLVEVLLGFRKIFGLFINFYLQFDPNKELVFTGFLYLLYLSVIANWSL